MSNRIDVRELDATGMVGDGSKALLDNGTWGTVSSSGGGGGGGGAMALMRRATDQSVTAATWTKLLFTATDTDTGGLADLANSRFTAATGGPHVFIAAVTCLTSADPLVLVAYVNGVASTLDMGRAISKSVQGTVVLDLAAGDDVELYLYSSVANTIRGAIPAWAALAVIGGGAAGGVGDIDGGTWDSTYLDFIDGGSF